MNFKTITVAVLLFAVWSDAQAWFWILRGAAARGTATTVTRGAAVAGSTTAGEAVAGFATRPIATAGRYCVRPAGATACDLHNATSARSAAQQAVGSGHTVRPGSRPGLFEVLDAAGNIAGIVEAIDRQGNPEVATLPQYVPEPQGMPVFIHNRSGQRLFYRIRGENCQFNELWVDPNMRSDISCPSSSTYFVEISTTVDGSGQSSESRQQINAGQHYVFVLAGWQPAIWQLAPLNN